MDELNGRMIACQLLIAGLIARIANDSKDPLRFLTDFRDEIRAVVNGINIAGLVAVASFSGAEGSGLNPSRRIAPAMLLRMRSLTLMVRRREPSPDNACALPGAELTRGRRASRLLGQRDHVEQPAAFALQELLHRA